MHYQLLFHPTFETSHSILVTMINKYRQTSLILALLLIVIPFCANAQSANTKFTAGSLQVVYRLDYKPDSAVATPKSEQMLLRISNGKSCFNSKVQHLTDSLLASTSTLPNQERGKILSQVLPKLGKTQLYYSIFKEPAKNLVFYHDIIGPINYQYQEKPPLFKWKITSVRNKVAGYECQQALASFGGRMFEAWFTRDIPVSDGPYKFYGLPGLIVKVRDTHDNYVFELVSLHSDAKTLNISATSPVPLIGKSKFKQAKLNDELTFVDRMIGMGNQVPESMRQNYAAELKRRNNPLELK